MYKLTCNILFKHHTIDILFFIKRTINLFIFIWSQSGILYICLIFYSEKIHNKGFVKLGGNLFFCVYILFTYTGTLYLFF